MKNRIEEINEMLEDIDREISLAVQTGASVEEVWKLIDRRTELVVEKHGVESRRF